MARSSAVPRPIPGPGRVWRLATAAAPQPGPLAKRGERNRHAEAPVALSMPSGPVFCLSCARIKGMLHYHLAYVIVFILIYLCVFVCRGTCVAVVGT